MKIALHIITANRYIKKNANQLEICYKIETDAMSMVGREADTMKCQWSGGRPILWFFAPCQAREAFFCKSIGF